MTPVFSATDIPPTAVDPAHDFAIVGAGYNINLSVSAGSPPIVWEIIDGPSTGTAQIVGSTLIWTGYTSGTPDVNWSVRAANNAGADFATWTTQVIG